MQSVIEFRIFSRRLFVVLSFPSSSLETPVFEAPLRNDARIRFVSLRTVIIGYRR